MENEGNEGENGGNGGKKKEKVDDFFLSDCRQSGARITS